MNRVLLVDDESSSRLAVKEYLETRGFDVCAVADGEQAVAPVQPVALQPEPAAGLRMAPAVLICDWLLPGEVGGLQVVSRLLAEFPRLVALVVTGLPVREVAREAGDLPVAGILSKPASLATIERSVLDALGD